jgi:hypothetical protein
MPPSPIFAMPVVLPRFAKPLDKSPTKPVTFPIVPPSLGKN